MYIYIQCSCFRCFGYVATEADLQELINEVGGLVNLQQFAHVRAWCTYECGMSVCRTVCLNSLTFIQVTSNCLLGLFYFHVGFF